ncbi:WD40 repeat domain-containing protein [Thermodesulfobacteriota bacterium]
MKVHGPIRFGSNSLKSFFLIVSFLSFPVVAISTGSVWYGLAVMIICLTATHIVSSQLIRYKIYLYDLETFDELPALRNWGHKTIVQSLSFSPDAKQIASCDIHANIFIWDITTGKIRIKLTGHGGYVNSVAFSPDGKKLVSGSHDSTIRIWDLKTGKELQQIKRESTITEVKFSPGGDRILSIEWEKDWSHSCYSARIYDSETGQLVQSIGDKDLFSKSAFFPDGKRMVSVYESKNKKDNVCIWKIESGDMVTSFPAFEGHSTTTIVASPVVAASPKGNIIALGSAKGMLHLYDYERREAVLNVNFGQYIRKVLFSPNGKIVAASLDATSDMSLILLDAVTGKELLKINHIKSNWGLQMAFSQNGTMFTTVGVKKGSRQYEGP